MPNRKLKELLLRKTISPGITVIGSSGGISTKGKAEASGPAGSCYSPLRRTPKLGPEEGEANSH